MTNPQNPLRRLVPLLEEAMASGSQNSSVTWAVWGRVFAIPGEVTERDRVNEVARCLALMHEELMRAKDIVATGPYEKSDYESAFNRVDEALNVFLLSQQWPAVAQYLTPESLSVLRLLSRTAPVQEETASLEELTALREAINDLEAAVRELDANDFLVSFFTDQIRIMRRALREYQIVGASALRIATYELEGSLRNQFSESAVRAQPPTPKESQAVHAAKKVLAVAKKVLIGTALLASGVEAPGKIARVEHQVVYYLTHGDSQPQPPMARSDPPTAHPKVEEPDYTIEELER